MEPNKPLQAINFDRPIPRPTFLRILNSASKLGEHRFIRQAALAWMASFPGDLFVNYLLAQAMVDEGKTNQAASIVNTLVDKDPEFLPAYELLANPVVNATAEKRNAANANVVALGGTKPAGFLVPEWTQYILLARKAIKDGKLDEAEEQVHQAMAKEPTSPLPAIYHVQIAHLRQDNAAVQNMAGIYHTRWPDCLQFSLYLAESTLKEGEESQSVALLHRCVALDAAAQVSNRLWGDNFPYQPLWPGQMAAYVNLPIPASVVADLGWNLLPGSSNINGGVKPELSQNAAETNNRNSSAGPLKGTSRKDSDAHRLPGSLMSPDALRSIQDEFERLARRLRRPEVGRADGRFPVYVIISTRRGLENQYGPQTAAVIDTEMHRLADAIRGRKTWGAIIYYADDPSCTATFGVKPAQSTDPWKLKLALADLDAALAKKGEMIGALLIVGGPEVVPFHHLPNPADDSDSDVISDNPYATLDENYFVPEWPVGRLPGGKGSDAGLLLGNLRRSVAYHGKLGRPSAWWFRNWFTRKAVKSAKSILRRPKTSIRLRPSFGYTAAVWRKSSVAVFRPIGEANALIVSPPARSGGSQGTVLTPSKMSYFNLHGLADAAEWYGQRDLRDAGDGPDYPVALSPKDIVNHGEAPKIIYSEACYGVHIEGKAEDQAMSLKFLSSGSMAVVGSTCIAYGSVDTPLIAADFLGSEFWKYLKEGHNVGDALVQAKLNLVQEMNKRQGYLDGEDQKTLISFILFGDPLVTLEDSSPAKKSFSRQRSHPSVKTISDQKGDGSEVQPIPESVVAEVKKIVDQYLPGLENADLRMSHQVASFIDNYDRPVAKSKKSAKEPKVPQRTVLTLSKQVTVATHTHQHYARVTLDKQGKMVKLCISR